MLRACDIAEEILGKPPTGIQIFEVLKEQGFVDFAFPVDSIYKVSGVLFSLMREHMLFCDKVGYTFTTQRREGYFLFTEIFDQMYPGYTMGVNQEVVPAPGTKTVNFNLLWDVLRSKDGSLLEKHADLFDGSFRFLDNTVPITNQKVAFCTYPRSGNSYLRRVFEQCTGISTGATSSLHTSTIL